VGRPFHCWRQVASTGMADVKTANPVQYLVAIPRRATVRITRHLAHGPLRSTRHTCACPRFPTARRWWQEYVQGLLLPVLIGEISPSGSARAGARFDRQRFEVALQIGRRRTSVNSPSLKRVHPGLDLNAQRFELQRIFASPLLQRPERVANGFACILVFPPALTTLSTKASCSGVRLILVSGLIFRVGISEFSQNPGRKIPSMAKFANVARVSPCQLNNRP